MRLQTSSAGLAIGDADNRYLRLAGGTMTGELNALAGLNTVRPYSSGLVPAGLSDPAPAFPFETEWNNAGKNWTAVRVSVTNTASGSASKLLDLQIGGVPKAWVDKYGTLYFSGGEYLGFNGSYLIPSRALAGAFICWGGQGLKFDGGSGGGDTAIERASGGLLQFTNAAGSLRDWKARRGSLSEYLDITEMSAPSAPSANTARLFVEDDGSGKTRLCVLFPTGAVQVLATEP